jgi:hypothetical protein
VSLGVLDLRAEALLRLLRWRSLRPLSRRDVTLTEGRSDIRARAGAELVTQDVWGLTDPTFAEQRGNTCYLMFTSKGFSGQSATTNNFQATAAIDHMRNAPAPPGVRCPTIRTLGAATGKQSCAEEAAAERKEGILV